MSGRNLSSARIALVTLIAYSALTNSSCYAAQAPAEHLSVNLSLRLLYEAMYPTSEGWHMLSRRDLAPPGDIRRFAATGIAASIRCQGAESFFRRDAKPEEFFRDPVYDAYFFEIRHDVGLPDILYSGPAPSSDGPQTIWWHPIGNHYETLEANGATDILKMSGRPALVINYTDIAAPIYLLPLYMTSPTGLYIELPNPLDLRRAHNLSKPLTVKFPGFACWLNGSPGEVSKCEAKDYEKVVADDQSNTVLAYASIEKNLWLLTLLKVESHNSSDAEDACGSPCRFHTDKIKRKYVVSWIKADPALKINLDQ